ncbi:MAG: type VI secretion system tip protein TssI/VgrG [Polyangiales bacterium]
MPVVFSDFDVSVSTDAVPDGSLLLRRMTGVESLSKPFEFQLVVESTTEGGLSFDEVDAILAQPWTLRVGDDDPRVIHGAVSAIDTLPHSTPSGIQYAITVVPRLWRTSLTFGTWVYQDLTVPEIVADVLQEAGFETGTDFEMRLSARYPKREYCVQYRETDLAFISRLCEHEGIFFFFEHADGVDKVVFGDMNVAFQPLEGHESISFDPRAGVTDLREVVTSIGRHRQVGAQKVGVKDFNYRTPDRVIGAGFNVDPQGVGLVMDYGDHFKDLPGAKRTARIRAEEIFCQRETYQLVSRVRGLRAGHRFGLLDHFSHDFEQEYLVTQVRHFVEQSHDASAQGSVGYHNEVTAIPYANAYRPPRVTPKPRIAGFIHAKIDGEGGSATADGSAPLDGEGRYRVAVLGDATKSAAGRSSRWVRRAQPFSGAGYGMHFPLHVGAEVMLVHLDGDPDRPVIVGAVPNPANASPVNAEDATLNRIRSRSGMVMGFHDNRG